MDVEFVRGKAAKASDKCRSEIDKIEEGLSPCFKTNPGRKLSAARCAELGSILDTIEETETAAFGAPAKTK
jgi:hypothetical protein